MARPLTDEEKAYLQGSAVKGPIPLKEEEKAYLQGAAQGTAPAEPPEATYGQMALHILKGVGQGNIENLEMDYNIPSMAEAGIKLAGGEGLPGFSSQENRPALAVGVDAIGGPGAYARLRETLAGEVVDKERYPTVDRLRTIAEWAAPGAIVNAGRRQFRKMLVDAAQGIGAAGGEAAEDYLTGDEKLTGAGEVFGGFSSGFGAARKFSKPASELQDAAAFAFIRAHSSDPNKAMAKLRAARARGDVGTLGDLTGDARISAMERATMRSDMDFGEELKSINEALQQQISDRVAGKFGDAPGQPAADAAKQASIDNDKLAVNKGEEFKATTREAAEQARATANEAAAPTWTPRRTDQTSASLQGRLDELDSTFKQQVEDPLWDAWRESVDSVDVAPIYDNIDSVLANIPVAERADLQSKYGRLLNQVGIWEDVADEVPQILGPNGMPLRPPVDAARTGSAQPGDVTSWLSRLRKAIDDNVRPDGSYTREGALLIEIKNAAENGLAETSDAFRAAKDATAERYARYRSGRTGAARLRGEGGPETYVNRVNLKGESGAQVIRELKNAQDPTLIGNVVEHLKAEAKKAGGVNNKFLSDYEAVIAALPPEAQAQFTKAAITDADLLRKTARADEAAKNIDATTQAELRANQTKPIAEYARNPKGYIKSLLTGDDNAPALKEIFGIMRMNGKADNFRGALRDTIKDLYLTGGDMSPEVRSKSIKAFRQTMDQIKEAKILDPKDIEDMTVQMNRSLTLSERVGALGPQMVTQGGDFQQLKASVLAVMTMRSIPGAGGTESLVLTGAIRRFFKHQLDLGGKKPGEVEALERMLANPDAYLEAAAKYGGVTESAAYLKAKPEERVFMVLNDAFKKAKDNVTTYTRRGQIAAGGDEDNGS